MIRASSAVLLLFLLTATGVVLWLGYDAHKLITGIDGHLNSKVGILARAEGLETKANATLVNIDNGTKIWAESARGQASTVQDLVTDARGTLSGADAALVTLNDSAHSLNDDLLAAHDVIDAGTATAHQAELDLRTLDGSFDALQPLLADSDRAVASFNALVSSPDLSQALGHVNGMTASGDAILADARKVADKTTADYLKPVKWYMQPVKKGSELIDITAAIARHTP